MVTQTDAESTASADLLLLPFAGVRFRAAVSRERARSGDVS
jgi:hypothetical protein